MPLGEENFSLVLQSNQIEIFIRRQRHVLWCNCIMHMAVLGKFPIICVQSSNIDIFTAIVR
jgi:hypothetical protein